MKCLSCFAKLLFTLVGLLAIAPDLVAQEPMPPFFLMGDGWVHIRNAQNNLEIEVNLLNADGSLNDAALSQVDAVFGFFTKDPGEHISPRLLFMLDYFSDLAAPGKLIHLHSGYRNPEYNSKLKQAGLTVAKTSLHIDGMALDFSIEGVKGRDLWEIIRQKNCCGVGHYGGEIVHLDAGRPRFWEKATAGVGTGESDYNRRLTLSTEFDRYRPGQRVRLILASLSDLGFGINRSGFLVGDREGEQSIAGLNLQSSGSPDCIFIQDRRATRFIYLDLPQEITEGRYRIRLNFCQRPFEQMPLKAVSNEIEIWTSLKKSEK
jgi:uncharacterized protein YcbK (DUF882 family)